MTDFDTRLNVPLTDDESVAEPKSTTSQISKGKDGRQLTSHVQSILNKQKRKRPQFTAEMLVGTKGLLKLGPAVVNYAHRVDNKHGKEVLSYKIILLFLLMFLVM
jgi:hypothetical protein